MFEFDDDHVYDGRVLTLNLSRRAVGREFTVWAVRHSPLLLGRPEWKQLALGYGPGKGWTGPDEAYQCYDDAVGRGPDYAAVAVVCAVGIDPFAGMTPSMSAPRSVVVLEVWVADPFVADPAAAVAPGAGQLRVLVESLY